MAPFEGGWWASAPEVPRILPSVVRATSEIPLVESCHTPRFSPSRAESWFLGGAVVGEQSGSSSAFGASSGEVDARLTIARFNPRSVPREAWAVIAPLARDAVAKVEPDTSRDATELLSRTALLRWACQGQGLEVKPEVAETLATFPCVRERVMYTHLN